MPLVVGPGEPPLSPPVRSSPGGGASGGAFADVLADPQGFCIAFDDDALTESPSWTRIDDPTGPFTVTGWQIDRGRAYELDRTEAGTASVRIMDFHGDFDPTNTSSPFYANLKPLKQAAIAIHDPIADAWSTVFRGFVESWQITVDVTESFTTVTVNLVDAFAILAAAELISDTTGDLTLAADQVNNRIIALLLLANWPTGLQTIFSGNVGVQQTVYPPRTQILSAIQDAADAEFPGIANFYTAKDGVVTFHGRMARFNPTDPSYGITTWAAGDEAAAG